MSIRVPASAMGEWTALQDALQDAGESVPCRTRDTELWWPQQQIGAVEAAALCRGCPVLAECDAYAVAAREPRGVWGGRSRLSRAKGEAA